MKIARTIGVLLLLLWATNGYSQSIAARSQKSPHGKWFKMDCGECHDPNGWKLRKNPTFNHDKTHFPLKGQHKMIDCRKCHSTLVFSEAKPDCNACHTDVHQQTVGQDCNRCHTTNSWIVTNIRQIHQQKGFALVGSHAAADCSRCHKAASQLQFENMHTSCDACHHQQYESSTIKQFGLNATHRSLGFNNDCYRCHNQVGKSWAYNGKGFEHGFFPLAGGHANLTCDQCHWDGFNTKLSRDCEACHSSYKAWAKFPAHMEGGAYTSHACSECHTYLSWNKIVFFGKHKPFRDKSKHKSVGCHECHNNNLENTHSCRKCHNFDS